MVFQEFEEKHIEKLGEFSGEIRTVETSPSLDLELSCVVPVYNEYENGNIFRLIESFTKQSESVDTFELILVVNNTAEDISQSSVAYKDNQQVINIPRYLSGELPIPEDLNDYRTSVLERAKTIGLRVQVVDITDRDSERNMGLIRDVGVEVATKRFEEGTNAKGSGVIAQLDCDTVVSPRYVREILKVFEDPSVESGFLPFDSLVTEGEAAHFISTYSYQFMYETWFFAYMMLSDAEGTTGLGGPRTVATVDAYKKIGGIDRDQYTNEDFKLADDFRNNTKHTFIRNARVYINDRAREDGFDASARSQSNGEYYEVVMANPKITLLAKQMVIVEQTDTDFLKNGGELINVFTKYGIPFDEKVFNACSSEAAASHSLRSLPDTIPALYDDPELRRMDREIEMYDTLQNYFERLGLPASCKPTQYASELIDILSLNASAREVEELRAFVHRNERSESLRQSLDTVRIAYLIDTVFERSESVQDIGTLNLTYKEVEFVQRNPWLLDRINALKANYTSSVEALDALKQEYPDLIGSYELSPNRRGTAMLKGVNEFLLDLEANPSLYPNVSKYLQTFGRFEGTSGEPKPQQHQPKEFVGGELLQERLEAEFAHRINSLRRACEELKIDKNSIFVCPAAMSRTDFGYMCDLDIVIVGDHSTGDTLYNYLNDHYDVFINVLDFDANSWVELQSDFPELYTFISDRLGNIGEEVNPGISEDYLTHIDDLEAEVRNLLSPEEKLQLKQERIKIGKEVVQELRLLAPVISTALSGSTVGDFARFSINSDLDVELLLNDVGRDGINADPYLLTRYLNWKYIEKYGVKIDIGVTQLAFAQKMAVANQSLKDYYKSVFDIDVLTYE